MFEKSDMPLIIEDTPIASCRLSAAIGQIAKNRWSREFVACYVTADKQKQQVMVLGRT